MSAKRKQPSDDNNNDCWIPHDLRAAQTWADCLEQQERVCKDFVLRCCAQIREEKKFPKRFEIPITTSCSYEKLVSTAKLQFETAGYLVTTSNRFLTISHKQASAESAIPSVVARAPSPPPYQPKDNGKWLQDDA